MKLIEIRKRYDECLFKNVDLVQDIKTLLDMLDEAKDALEFVVNNSGTSTDYNLRARQALEKLR